MVEHEADPVISPTGAKMALMREHDKLMMMCVLTSEADPQIGDERDTVREWTIFRTLYDGNWNVRRIAGKTTIRLHILYIRIPLHISQSRPPPLGSC